jgi:hypothetical protein
LEKIVKYRNKYGVVHAKRWKDMTRKDLESFFAVLFISGIQKRKDKPSNWFSENKLLESTVIKKVRRTRYQCGKCGIPLCSIGIGKVGDDCFTMGHKTDETLEIVLKKNLEMKRRVRNSKNK